MTDTLLLKTIVGSTAHGLSTPESDVDYRGTFITPTSEILSLGGHQKHTSWIEGNTDDTAFEIGHFLFLATKCNPTILEVFLAPVAESVSPWAEELRSLLPHIWHSQGVRNAFVGYGLNQRKKFLDTRDRAPNKFAVAYLRTLYQAYELLSTGTFTVRIAETPIGTQLRAWRQGQYTIGEVVQVCREWEEKVNEVYETESHHEANLAPVNDFLLRVRKEYW